MILGVIELNRGMGDFLGSQLNLRYWRVYNLLKKNILLFIFECKSFLTLFRMGFFEAGDRWGVGVVTSVNKKTNFTLIRSL